MYITLNYKEMHKRLMMKTPRYVKEVPKKVRKKTIKEIFYIKKKK